MSDRVVKSFRADDAARKERQVADLPHAPNANFSDNFPDRFKIARKTSCACGGECPDCKAKAGRLTVSQPNDPAEIEADAMVEKVMRAGSGASHSPLEQNTESPAHTLHRKALPSSAAIPAQSPHHVQTAMGSGGHPLDSQSRSFFEPRMGYDLSRVRVYTDSAAGQSAHAVNARAYSLGSNIVFGQGEYQPQTDTGRRLLAHELAHTVHHHDHLYRLPGDQPSQIPAAQDGGASGSYDGDPADVQMPTAPPRRSEAGVDVDVDRDETGATPMGASGSTAEITLETGNSGAGVINNLVHQQICVDRPSRSKRCFSFAATGGQLPQFSSTWLGWDSWVTGAILKGEVYDPAPVSGATIESTHTPTVAEADNWVDYMDTKRLGLTDGYSVARHNCRLFSQWEFRDAPLHY